MVETSANDGVGGDPKNTGHPGIDPEESAREVKDVGSNAGGSHAEAASTRIDRWLSAARIFKSRSQAQIACEAGHVLINDVKVKPSRVVAVGDTVTARAPRGLVILVVRNIEEKRQGSARAKELYEDRSPPPAQEQEPRMGIRDRGAGRPTKADRRAIARLTGFDADD